MSEPNPAQEQYRQPGFEGEMEPEPRTGPGGRAPSRRLEGKRALITGGDSGIGRAVATLFAREGARVAIGYLDEHEDAEDTLRRLEAENGSPAAALPGDIGDAATADDVVEGAVDALGGLDVLVNNAAEQHTKGSLAEITPEQVARTFATNVYSMFNVTRAALAHLRDGAAIINSTSVTAYQGNPVLIDYSASKGAIVSFTRALASSLTEQGIRVNAVAPGPVWTPLIPASFEAHETAAFGGSTPMGRPGEPEEIAPSYLFLATDDAAYMSGQVLHPNGGQVVGS